MSDEYARDARLAEHRGPFNPVNIGLLHQTWCSGFVPYYPSSMVTEALSNVPGYRQDCLFEPFETSDGYMWQGQAAFDVFNGIAVIAFPYRNEGGISAERCVAVYTRGGIVCDYDLEDLVAQVAFALNPTITRPRARRTGSGKGPLVAAIQFVGEFMFRFKNLRG